MRLVVNIDAKAVLDQLAGMASAATDPREAFVEVGDLFLDQEKKYWRSASWIPLKPDSARRKAKRGRSTRPLVGGSLEKSLTIKGARYTVRRINKQSITMGTRHPLANIHDKGTRGALPRRPLISVSKADRAAYRGVFVRHLRSARGRRTPARSLL